MKKIQKEVKQKIQEKTNQSRNAWCTFFYESIQRTRTNDQCTSLWRWSIFLKILKSLLAINFILYVTVKKSNKKDSLIFLKLPLAFFIKLIIFN